mgnify:CR=1 FL=1
MKKNTFITLLLVFLLLIAVSLSGCKKTPDVTATNTVQVEATAEAAVAELENASADAQTAAPAPQPESLHAELEKNLTIDAKVTAPSDANASIPTIRVQEWTPDPEKVRDLVFPNAVIETDYSHYSNDPDYTSWQLDGDRGVTTNKGSIYASTPFGDAVTQLYAVEWILNDESLARPDLSFASREAVIQQVQTLLAEIGLKHVRCDAIYALTADQLQSASDHMAEEFAAEIQEGRLAYKEKWTADDECYVLNLQITMGEYGLPIFSDDTIKSFAFTELHYDNCELEAVVSKNGVESLRVFRAVQEVEQGAADPILNAEKLPGLISGYYQNIIVERPTTITEIALNYVMFPVDSGTAYELKPVWCCHAITRYEADDEIESKWIVFDARSGQIYY